MTKVRVVTGYVPIPGHPRGAEEYEALGRRLAALRGAPVTVFRETLAECWLSRALETMPGKPTHSVGDNPAKNTLAYHVAIYQKTEWLERAASAGPEAETVVWLDCGILRLPGIDEQVIEEFLSRVRPDDLAIPGCWERGPIRDDSPCWRFCGGVAVVPTRWVVAFNRAVKALLIAHVERTRNVPWEVNTWARLEAAGVLPIRWYAADHDRTMFTNYAGAPAGGG